MIHWWLIANATSQFFLRLFRTSQKYSMHHFHHVWRIFKEISCRVVRVQNSNWKSFQELDIDWVTTVQCQSVIAKTTFIYVKMPQIFTWGFVLCLETTVEGMTNIHKQALLKHLFQSLHILHSLFWRYRNKSKKIGAGFWAELLGGLGIFSWKHPTSWLNKARHWSCVQIQVLDQQSIFLDRTYQGLEIAQCFCSSRYHIILGCPVMYHGELRVCVFIFHLSRWSNELKEC